MTTPSLQGFVQQTTNLASHDHVRLTTDAGGDKVATRARDNFGTKAAEWFRGKLSVKDPATKAFKAAVRAEVSPKQAKKIFRDAGIRSSRPLTRGQITQASNAVNRVLRPLKKTPATTSLKVNSLATAPQTQATTPTQATTAQTPTTTIQSPPPGIDAFPDLVKDCWKHFQSSTTDLERMAYLKSMAQALPDPLSTTERDALRNLVAGNFESVASMVNHIQQATQGSRKDWSMGAMRPVIDVIVELCPTHDQILLDFAKDWQVQARSDREPGTRLSSERQTLKELNDALSAATTDQERQTALDGFKQLGGKMIAAIFEQSIRASGPYDGKTAVFGEVSFDRGKHGDVAALLEKFGDVPMHANLLPELKGAFLPIFEQATVDFAKTYGSGAGVAALIALRKAGVDPGALGALKTQIASTISDRSSMQKLALHGSTTDPRIVDPTAAFCRALVLELGGDVAFEPLQSATGNPIAPPELEPKVDTASIETATQLSDVLGKDFQPRASDGSQYQANGRTLRFTAADGKVIALKFMRNNETPGKLQREHESFGLMQSALGGKFAASPRKLGAQADQAMIRIPEHLLPKEALDKLNAELQSGGLTAFQENGSYLVMSYEVNAEVGDKFFNYLESSTDDKTFRQGFTDSMSALGKMASHGYFNPNLIQNAYHAPAKGDSDSARGWIWSMNLLKPGRDNTGKEDQQLANAKWSNFREGGLADPDEFRHLDHLKSTELGKLLGDKVMASELQENKQSFESLLPTYLIGRMFHESLVIATRRMVDAGAFAPGVSPDRQRELVDTFKSGLREGIEAFAKEFTGQDGQALAAALSRNGLNLDQAIDKVARERAAMFSFEYAGKMRAKDADYFGQLFGIDKAIIEFDPPASNAMRDNGELVPLETILKSDDPLAMFNRTQQPGFTTVLITDGNGKIQHAVDLGWMTNNLDEHQDIFTADGNGVARFELRNTARDGKLAIIEAGPNFNADQYLAGTKARAHQYQNIGGYNATYFFQNEQHLNHVLSATLVELRST